MNTYNDNEKILDIESSLYNALFDSDNGMDDFNDALECVPKNITGMRALLSFCESYDCESAYEYLLNGGVFEKLAIEHEYYRLYNVITHAVDTFYGYANYELELTKVISEQEDNNFTDDIEVVLKDSLSESLTDDEKRYETAREND